ncbi:MAG: hypothetical protein H0U16_01905 [Actinobacteria bacterium]|nr:hypothetical protein [Actinomycetota bacterium]
MRNGTRWGKAAVLAITVMAASAVPAAAPGAPRRADRDTHEGRGLERAHQRLHQHELRATTGPSPQKARTTREITARPAAAKNFKVLGHEKLPGPTPNGDVLVYDHGGDVGTHAYVGTWSFPCSGTGVKIIDVNDPRNPEMVALAGTRKGISNEDMVVRHYAGRDVMAIGVQACGEEGAQGVRLVDVTDPSHPQQFSFFRTPGGVHELDMVKRRDGRVLALLALPFVEFGNTYFGTDSGGEFRIVDVTDPTAPVELAEWGMIEDSSAKIFGGNDELSSSFQGLGNFAAHFAHSVRGANRGKTAYVSYWDGGVLKFDIGNPSSPQLLARTSYRNNADGDAHSMTPYRAGGKRYIFQNDEDFSPLATPTVTTGATGNMKYPGVQMPWAPTLLSGGAGLLSGRTFDAGEGCSKGDYAGARDRVVLVDVVDPFYVGVIPNWSVPCNVGRQVLLAARAGARAVVLNLVSPDDAFIFEPNEERLDDIQRDAVGMPIVMVSNIDDMAAKIRRAGGAVRIEVETEVPSWGFLRVYREDTARDRNGDGIAEYRQVGHFSDLNHVRGENETPPGDWSIHNTEIHGDRAYAAWYSQGIVALDLTSPAHPQKAGHFVPPPSCALRPLFGFCGAEVWGVAVDHSSGLIYASDMGSGLWIVKPTGAAASTR